MDLGVDLGALKLVGVEGVLMVQGKVGVALMKVQVVVEIHCQNEDWQKI